MEKASAIVIVRQLQFGIILGTKGGGGFAMAKNEETGEWSAPAFVKTREGSVGLQFGMQKANAIYVVMAPEVMDKLLKSGLKIGLDISARVGPVGADIELDSNFEKFPEVFVYSKNEGLFAGVNFTAENFDGDKKANKIFYGKDVITKDILFNNAVEMPEEAVSFTEYLMSYYPSSYKMMRNRFQTYLNKGEGHMSFSFLRLNSFGLCGSGYADKHKSGEPPPCFGEKLKPLLCKHSSR